MPTQLSLFDDTPFERKVRLKGSHNLFFAIRPPISVGSEILERKRQVRGAPLRGTYQVGLRQLHVSLLGVCSYPYQLPAAVLRAASAAAALIRFEPFEICFDHIITFKDGPVVMRMPEENLRLLALRMALADALDDIEMPTDFKPGFVPHISLSYGNGFKGEHLIDPIRWWVDEFVLIDSLQGYTQHKLVGNWSLAP